MLKCEICKKKVYARRKFHCCESNQYIPLCRNHDREMFLMGEFFMLIKYEVARKHRKLKENMFQAFIKKIEELGF